jgi:hypothetical protein
MKWVLLVLIVFVSMALLSRETLVIGEARRQGAALKPHLKRFRRRTKGLLLLIVLYLAAILFNPLSQALSFTAHEFLLYFGFYLVLFIWLMIVTVRDVRQTAIDALMENKNLTAKSLGKIEQELSNRSRPDGDNDYAPIRPGMTSQLKNKKLD